MQKAGSAHIKTEKLMTGSHRLRKIVCVLQLWRQQAVEVEFKPRQTSLNFFIVK